MLPVLLTLGNRNTDVSDTFLSIGQDTGETEQVEETGKQEKMEFGENEKSSRTKAARFVSQLDTKYPG